MALSAATIKGTILAEMAAAATIEDPAKAAIFAEFMSQVLLKVLTQQATVVVGSGSSAGSYSIS